METNRSHLFQERNQLIGMVALYIVVTLLSLLFFKHQGTEYLDRTLGRATASYALARGLNGIVTVVKESSISAGLVVEGTIAIGQILDPVNDLVERFSWVMLLSIVSLGVQKILMEIGVPLGIAVFVVSIAAVFCAKWLTSARKLGGKLLIFAILVQAAIPVTAVVGSVISGMFLQDRYQQAERAITKVQQEMEDEYALGNGERENGQKGKWYEKYDPNKIVQRVKTRASEVIDHLVNLITIFVFETIILPLATLWGLIQVLKMLIGKT